MSLVYKVVIKNIPDNLTPRKLSAQAIERKFRHTRYCAYLKQYIVYSCGESAIFRKFRKETPICFLCKMISSLKMHKWR